MIRVDIVVEHQLGTVHVHEWAPVAENDTEDLVNTILKAAVKRAHRRAATALLNPIEMED